MAERVGGLRRRGTEAAAAGLSTLETFLSRLSDIEDADALAAGLAEISRPYNLPTIMAGAVYVHGSVTRARFFFGNWPPEWMARYTDEVLANDPLVGEARRRMAPFTWSELQADGGLSPEMMVAFATGAEAGWTDGFAVPIHGPAGYTALVSFAGKVLRLSPLDRAILRTAAHAAHDRCRELARKVEKTQEALTHREREVMRWVACGKSDWEVGRILGISQRTAHFHVEQVKHKLGLHSRGQAVGALVMSGDL